jgi:hypothetical protein
MVKKAITHLKLDQANPGKLAKLDELAVEHQRVVQAYVTWLIAHEQREPDKYANIPEAEIPSALSDRWQRCMWQQACGIVQSWYSNERTNPPVLKNICLQANTNVVKLEKSTTPTFDFWLKISTLEKAVAIQQCCTQHVFIPEQIFIIIAVWTGESPYLTLPRLE